MAITLAGAGGHHRPDHPDPSFHRSHEDGKGVRTEPRCRRPLRGLRCCRPIWGIAQELSRSISAQGFARGCRRASRRVAWILRSAPGRLRRRRRRRRHPRAGPHHRGQRIDGPTGCRGPREVPAGSRRLQAAAAGPSGRRIDGAGGGRRLPSAVAIRARGAGGPRHQVAESRSRAASQCSRKPGRPDSSARSMPTCVDRVAGRMSSKGSGRVDVDARRQVALEGRCSCSKSRWRGGLRRRRRLDDRDDDERRSAQRVPVAWR